MKTAIITGVSEGLGYEVAKVLIEKNYKVIGISRTKPNLDINHIQADITSKSGILSVVERIKTDYSDFNFLLNIAGKLNITPLNKVDYDETENLLNLNVLAPIILASNLIDLIKKNEADIINIGSSIGYKSYENQLAYTASKWAIRGINANLQLELKGTKSRVIGFNPGGFKSKIFEKATGKATEDWSGYMDPQDLAKFIHTILELPKNMEVSEILINRK